MVKAIDMEPGKVGNVDKGREAKAKAKDWPRGGFLRTCATCREKHFSIETSKVRDEEGRWIDPVDEPVRAVYCKVCTEEGIVTCP